MAKETFQAACLLQMLFLPLFPAAGRQQTGVSSGVRCLNNYGLQARRIDCTWHRNQTLGEGPFNLTFSDIFKQQSDLVCQLLPSHERPDEFSCSAEGLGAFEENDKYRVYLHDASSSSGRKVIYEETYEPMRNIKCDAPTDFRSNMSGSKCRVEWRMPEAYQVIWEAMQWQLQFRPTHFPSWEQVETKTVVSEETWMEIDSFEFTPGTSYIARVRCKTPDSSDAYISHWSEWSTPAKWSVPPGPLLRQLEEESRTLLAAFVSVPLCLGALLLLLLLLASCHSRLQRCCWASTPSPAAFFLPLYASHQGDFQAWIGIKEQDGWLRSGNSTDSGKGAGPSLVTLRPLEAISHLSSFTRLSAAELPSKERVGRLLGVPDPQDQASDYVAVQGAAQAQALPGRPPLHLGGGLNAASEGFPYFPYRNSLFVEQEPWKAKSLSSCRKAPGSQGTSVHSMDPTREAQQGGGRLTTAGTALCEQVQAFLPTQASPAPSSPIQVDSSE